MSTPQQAFAFIVRYRIIGQVICVFYPYANTSEKRIPRNTDYQS